MAKPSMFEQGRLSRRQALQGIGASGALAWGLAHGLRPESVQANTPQSGGVIRIRGKEPRGWDPVQTTSAWTHIGVSLVYNGLFRYKAGPEVEIGTMTVEPDLVERWEAPSDTQYIFHLRQGVHFQDKPPVGGREMVAEDVRYSIERFMTEKRNWNRTLLPELAGAKVLDKYTVQVDLNAPNVWFLDYLARASTIPIVAKEAVDKFGSLKKPEAVIGTGPWMLDSYTPKSQAIFKKNPNYFRTGMPYIDEVQFLMIADDATATAAYMSGQLDLAPGFYHTLRGSEFRTFREKHPDWYYKGFRWNIHSYVTMRTDQAPFNDQRVRQAMSMAVNRQAFPSKWLRLDTAVPSSFKEWHLPVDQLGEGAQYYEYNPEEAKRLLREAGHPNGFETKMLVHTGFSPVWANYVERMASWFGDVGIKVQIVDKELGPYVRLLRKRKYDGLLMTPATPDVIPDSYVYRRYRKDNIASNSRRPIKASIHQGFPLVFS